MSLKEDSVRLKYQLMIHKSVSGNFRLYWLGDMNLFLNVSCLSLFLCCFCYVHVGGMVCSLRHEYTLSVLLQQGHFFTLITTIFWRASSHLRALFGNCCFDILFRIQSENDFWHCERNLPHPFISWVLAAINQWHSYHSCCCTEIQFLCQRSL